jgi:hypothetical protein
MLSPNSDWRDRVRHTTIGKCQPDADFRSDPTITHIGCRPITPRGRNIDITMEHYEIRLHGHLGALMLTAFPSLSAEIRGADTVLRGPIQDRAALHGVLTQVDSFGLELIELRRLPARASGLPDTGDAELPRTKRGSEHD